MTGADAQDKERVLFWDVDTQADFMLPGGALYVPGAEVLIPNLKRLTGAAAQNAIPIVASADAHLPTDPELAQYPPHCLVGTPGQKKIPETLLPGAITVPNRPVPDLDVGHARQIILEKQQLDVFSNPNTEVVLAQFGPAWDVILYGVVTELCVSHAAHGLIQRGYHLRIVSDAIRHLDPAQGEAFLQEMRDSGGVVVSTQEALQRFGRGHAA